MRIGKQRSRVLALDMTPMIDVVFLLLIFFLTTSQLAELAASELELPQEAGGKESAAASGLMVNIGPTGTLTVLDEEVGLAALPNLARAALGADPAAVPVIRADRAAAAVRLNEVMEALRAGGCRGVRLATVSRTEGGP